jgi:WD40 repeat protein
VRPPARLRTRGGSDAFIDASYSADGKRILTSSEGEPADLWDPRNARRIATLEVDGGVGLGGAVFSGDGARVATTASRGRTQVWSAADGAAIGTVEMGESSALSIALNRDGTLVAAPLPRRGIGVWGVRSGRRLGSLGGRQRFYNVRFTVGGDLVAIGVGRRSSLRVSIWPTSRGRRVGTLDVRRRTDPVTALDVGRRAEPIISADGRRAFIASRGHPPRLVDVRTRRRLGKGIGHLHPLAIGTFTTDGRYLATADGRTATLWNAKTGGRRAEHRFSGTLQSAVPSVDGSKVVVVFNNGAMSLWEPGSDRGTPITRGRSRTRDAISSVAISPDGAQALTTGYPSQPGLWDLRDVGPAGVVLGGHDAPLSDLAVDGRGRIVATGATDGTVRVWERASGRELGSLAAGRGPVVRVAFDRDGGRLASGDADGTAAIWDVATRRRIAVVHARAELTDVALDPGGRRIATADKAGTAVITPVEGGRPPTVIHASPRRLLSVRFSPDGRTLLTASGRSARTWDAASGRPRERLKPGKKFRFDCCFVPYPGAFFSPDGRRIAMIGTDGGLRLWDEQGSLLRELQADDHQIINHAAFSRDSSLIAAGGDDNAVHLIDGRTGTDAGRLQAPGAEIARVGFSPDGTKVAGLAAGGLTRVWDVASRKHLALLQGRAPADFYLAEFSPDGKQIITSDGASRVVLHPCLVCLSPAEMVPVAKAAAHGPLTASQRRTFLHER